MAFALKREESVPKGWTRLSKKCVKKALRLCEKSDLESIHSARKEIKKLRALLRLVECNIGKKSFKNVNEHLRKAARRLSAARDAQVQLETLNHLLRSDRLEAAHFSRFQGLLKGACRRELAAFRMRKHCKPRLSSFCGKCRMNSRP